VTPFSRTRREMIVLGSAALTAAGRPAISQPLTKVRVGAAFTEGLTPVLYGMQAGIFTQHGFDIDLRAGPSGGVLATSVTVGAIDIANASLMALITAYTRGIFFKILAGGTLHLAGIPTNDILVLRDSPIKTGADANGKTVAVVTLGSLDGVAVSAYVDEHGGDSTTLKFIELPYSAMVPALQQGRIDLATIATPTMAAAIAGGKVRVFAVTFDSIAKRFLLSGWFSTAAYAQQNPDVARRFRDAVYQATAYTNAHHEETVPILAAYSGTEPDVIRKMTREVNSTSLEAIDVQPVIDVAVKYKLIKAQFAARELLLG
jgi:NitT/TauT family transport system substrate-binding protein